jgi:2-oxo-4-hydroxy-4-carboxy-5-ureidoimidazoline decarboxylase
MPNLAELNSLSKAECIEGFHRCCASHLWAERMASLRPFKDESALFAAADLEWKKLSREDWLEAFGHHPRIGNREALRGRFAATATWSTEEQAGVNDAHEAVLDALEKANKDYETRFGFVFLVCATGKTAPEMLTILNERMPNPSDRELLVAGEEQSKITRIRLEKWLTS